MEPRRRIIQPRRLLVLGWACLPAPVQLSSLAFISLLDRRGAVNELDQGGASATCMAGPACGYLVMPYGFIFDHFGPKPIFILSIVLFPLGALLFALSFRGTIEGSVVRLSVFNAILTLGCTLYDVVYIMTIMSHFPISKGPVVAILKSYIGLGSAIVGSIQLAFFDGRPDHYFYFLMVLFFVTGSAGFFLVPLPSYHLTGYEEKHLGIEEKERRLARKSVYLRQQPPTIRFAIGIAFVVLLVIYLPLQSALVAYLGWGRTQRIIFASILIAVLVSFPLMALPVSCLERRETQREEDDCGGTERPSAGDEVANEPAAAGGPPKKVETDVDYIAPQYQTTFLQNLKTLKLWAFLWSVFSMGGTMFVIIYNASFVYAALADEEVDNAIKTLLTVLNGVGSAAGRLLMSYFEVWSQKRKAEDRVSIIVSVYFADVFVILSLVLFLVVPRAALPLPYVLAALGNGFSAASLVLVSRTVFAKDPAKHYNFIFLALVSSTIFLNRLLYGEWYTREAEKQGGNVCLGRNCVMMPLIFLIVLSFTAFLSAAYFDWEYRRFSRLVLEERRRLKERAGEGLLAVESPPLVAAERQQEEEDAGNRTTTPANDRKVARP
ncbi:protein associated with differentiation 4 [Trypanosoma cruzi]|uniref:Protein associated with differentiation 4 n=1 Tax=Trypanosoma cruzi TaxID=5693 RepID=A0A7J6XP97_TRYCR|nr:protein associated with differentiation 4 [Trypanosoma cruzi]